MYSIIANGGEIGIVETPNFIKQQSNGFYIRCDEPSAQGVYYAGTVYQLADREPLTPEMKAVRIVEIDAGARISEHDQVASIVFVAATESGSIDDVTAGEHAEMFEEWAQSVTYAPGNVRRYNGQLYRCIEGHTSQADWTPDVAVSLWACVADPAEEWPAWARPIGAHDAYSKGDKVSHNERHWVSDYDANVWEPGVYGWSDAE